MVYVFFERVLIDIVLDLVFEFVGVFDYDVFGEEVVDGLVEEIGDVGFLLGLFVVGSLGVDG